MYRTIQMISCCLLCNSRVFEATVQVRKTCQRMEGLPSSVRGMLIGRLRNLGHKGALIPFRVQGLGGLGCVRGAYVYDVGSRFRFWVWDL